MVEYNLSSPLDSIFGSLADPTRRSILEQVSRQSMSVGQIAKDYDLTFAAVSKHLKVLQTANLVSKQRNGKEQIVSLSPAALKEADDYLKQYHEMWNDRFDRLEQILNMNGGGSNGRN
jgi:DNA-binding transcriptional ArsR family regulator